MALLGGLALILAGIGGFLLLEGGQSPADAAGPLLLTRAEAVQRFTRSFVRGYAAQVALLAQSLAAGAAPAEVLRGVVARDPLVARVQLLETDGLAWRAERAEEGVRLVQGASPGPGVPPADPVGRMVISGPDLEEEGGGFAAGIPTLHFAQRVSSEDQRMVMLTVDASPLLQGSDLEGPGVALQRSVLDEEGYWLSGAAPGAALGGCVATATPPWRWRTLLCGGKSASGAPGATPTMGMSGCLPGLISRRSPAFPWPMPRCGMTCKGLALLRADPCTTSNRLGEAFWVWPG
ncbi:hypothetical protein [Pararhodospirillum photometricum]|uniref:hypothetical protein n=1 Tax=Pararhodospirillum photometricum TaxID=1084 RepID=UPI0002D7B1C2|nr:hypothetical protein [Pararhodospirillum photometricum]